ncbi:MAG: ABC transporter permease [Acidimicrobiia bacterium]|nr:ABC transporter permease [Acidimicrobiia bacterium]
MVRMAEQVTVHRPTLASKVGAALSHPVVFSLVFAFALGWLIVYLTGRDPGFAYSEMLNGAVTGSGLRNTLGRAVPIIGMALAVSVAFRSGVINLGGEGQMVVGGLAGALVAIYTPGPGELVIPLAMVAGGVAGAAWAMLPAFGQTRLRLPILITSLLLNYVARAITGYLVRFHFLDDSVTLTSTRQVPEIARMPRMPIFGGVSLSLALVIVLVAVAWVVYGRTVSGYETQMAGLNGRFARYGGIQVERQTVGVMVVAGTIGGIIGTHMIIGDAYRFIDGELVVSGLAWTGLLVALLAANHPVMILVAGLLFSGLQIGGLAMQRNADVSWRLSQVLQALVIVAVASRLTFGWFKRRRTGPSEGELEPAAVGEV